MSDIFLSYSHEDRSVAQGLADALQRRGWSVFWDIEILPGDDFEQKFAPEAEAAGCIVVLWSKSSVKSKWVLREAEIGRRRERLLPVLIDTAKPPKTHANLTFVDLKGWAPDRPHPGFKDLLIAIVRLLGGEPWKRAAFEAALRNFERFGDTDVLPFPIEKTVFSENHGESLELLQRIDAKFETFVEKYPPYYETSPCPVGVYGFRWVTQIDPVWNAYLLGLVTAVGRSIEAVRPPADQQIVFSYRFNPDPETGALFEEDVGWRQYQERSLVLAKEFLAWAKGSNEPHVVVCDIADFYSRITHGHIREALDNSGADPGVTHRILVLLKHLAGGNPYGLPIGGPASRLLSEVVLQSVDNLLSLKRVAFCRFADDYHVFASDENDAYQKLMFLSETLFGQLGLTLQKSKTRIMSAKELIATSPLRPDAGGAERWALVKLKISFDPYAEGRIKKYEEARDEINKHDLLGMLARELQKSRPDPALTRRLIDAVKFLSPENRKIAVLGLLDPTALEKLYPSLSILLRTFRYLVAFGSESAAQPCQSFGVDEETSRKIFDMLADLIQKRSYLMGIPTHLAYAVRVLVHDARPETSSVLVDAYSAASSSSMVRRDVILAMSRRRSAKCDDWLRGLLRQEMTLTAWERRALLAAAVKLGEVGRQFLKGLAGRISPMDRLTLEWAESKTSTRERTFHDDL